MSGLDNLFFFFFTKETFIIGGSQKKLGDEAQTWRNLAIINSSTASPIYFIFFLHRWKNHNFDILFLVVRRQGLSATHFSSGRGREADDDASRTSAARRLNLAARAPHDFGTSRAVCAGLEARPTPTALTTLPPRSTLTRFVFLPFNWLTPIK